METRKLGEIFEVKHNRDEPRAPGEGYTWMNLCLTYVLNASVFIFLTFFICASLKSSVKSVRKFWPASSQLRAAKGKLSFELRKEDHQGPLTTLGGLREFKVILTKIRYSLFPVTNLGTFRV